MTKRIYQLIKIMLPSESFSEEAVRTGVGQMLDKASESGMLCESGQSKETCLWKVSRNCLKARAAKDVNCDKREVPAGQP